MSRSTAARLAGAGLLALTGIVHLKLTPEHLEEMPYIGVLFLLGGVSSLVIAAWLAVREQPLAWTAGAALAGGMLLALVLSRTTGLPSFKEQGLEPAALVCLIDEAAFLALSALTWPPAARAVRTACAGR